MELNSSFVSLMKKSLAKNEPAAVLSEVQNDDGKHYKQQESFQYSQTHGLDILSRYDNSSCCGTYPGLNLSSDTPDNALLAGIGSTAAGVLGLVLTTQCQGVALAAGIPLLGVGILGLALSTSKMMIGGEAYGSPDGY